MIRTLPLFVFVGAAVMALAGCGRPGASVPEAAAGPGGVDLDGMDPAGNWR
jgi:hypothetical protein